VWRLRSSPCTPGKHEAKSLEGGGGRVRRAAPGCDVTGGYHGPMTALRPDADDTRTRPSRLAAVPVVLCCGALAALGATAGPSVLVGVLFLPALMLPLALLLLVVSGFVNAAILRTATGRRQKGLAVALTLLVPAGVGIELVMQGELTLGPRYGLPVPLVIAAVAAGVSTFAFPRWGRWVGGLTIVLAAVPLAWQLVPDAARDASASRVREEASPEAVHDARSPEETTTLPGATTLPGVATELRVLGASVEGGVGATVAEVAEVAESPGDVPEV